MTGDEIGVYVRRLTELRDQAVADAARCPVLADYSRGAASAYGLALHALYVFSGGAVEVPADVLGAVLGDGGQ